MVLHRLAVFAGALSIWRRRAPSSQSQEISPSKVVEGISGIPCREVARRPAEVEGASARYRLLRHDAGLRAEKTR